MTKRKKRGLARAMSWLRERSSDAAGMAHPGIHPLSGLRSPLPSRSVERPAYLGTVCVLTQEDGRFSRFWIHLQGLIHPNPIKLITKFSVDIAQARNEAIQEAEGDWIFFVDDDHEFPPDLLMRLLQRNVPIIQPLILSRYAPFGPVIMGQPTAEGSGARWRYALKAGESGLKPVWSVGMAMTLIRREVWEAIGPPWFTVGSIAPDVGSEDVSFCDKARARGIGIYCDLDLWVGHLNVGSVSPKRLDDGSWVTVLNFGSAEIEIPSARARMAIVDGEEVALPPDQEA